MCATLLQDSRLRQSFVELLPLFRRELGVQGNGAVEIISLMPSGNNYTQILNTRLCDALPRDLDAGGDVGFKIHFYPPQVVSRSLFGLAFVGRDVD
jgi:hypothetical protein